MTRRSKIIGHNYGLLYRDVAFLPKEIYIRKPLNGEFRDSPTVCIEIKVKQGYMMNDDSSGEELNTIKCRFCYFQVCQFVIHSLFLWYLSTKKISLIFQYLKLKNAKIKNVSSYCPIDLFSGNAQRMNSAIKGLFKNPQNNLKMFMNGKTVYNEYSDDKLQLKRVLKNIFPNINCSNL